jgi:hypothetical protein
VAVTVTVCPEVVEVRERPMPPRTVGVTVNVADRVAPYVAVMPTVVEVLTNPAATANDADSAPAGTITVAGTVAVALPDERFTTAPPAGAGPFSVTNPTLLPPLPTEAGERLSAARDIGETLTVVVGDAPP